MAETYSVAITGAPADNTYGQKSLTVGDSVARCGGQQGAMALKTPFLCKGPDGGQAWYTFDAERSRPGGPYFLVKV